MAGSCIWKCQWQRGDLYKYVLCLRWVGEVVRCWWIPKYSIRSHLRINDDDPAGSVENPHRNTLTDQRSVCADHLVCGILRESWSGLWSGSAAFRCNSVLGDEKMEFFMFVSVSGASDDIRRA